MLIYLHRCPWVCCCFSNPWSCTWTRTTSAVNVTLCLKVHQLHHPSSTSFVWVKGFHYNMHPTASWFLGGINSTTIQLCSLVWASNRSNHSFCDRPSVQVQEYLIPVLYRTIHNAVFQAPHQCTISQVGMPEWGYCSQAVCCSAFSATYQSPGAIVWPAHKHRPSLPRCQPWWDCVLWLLWRRSAWNQVPLQVQGWYSHRCCRWCVLPGKTAYRGNEAEDIPQLLSTSPSTALGLPKNLLWLCVLDDGQHACWANSSRRRVDQFTTAKAIQFFHKLPHARAAHKQTQVDWVSSWFKRGMWRRWRGRTILYLPRACLWYNDRMWWPRVPKWMVSLSVCWTWYRASWRLVLQWVQICLLINLHCILYTLLQYVLLYMYCFSFAFI